MTLEGVWRGHWSVRRNCFKFFINPSCRQNLMANTPLWPPFGHLASPTFIVIWKPSLAITPRSVEWCSIWHLDVLATGQPRSLTMKCGMVVSAFLIGPPFRRILKGLLAPQSHSQHSQHAGDSSLLPRQANHQWVPCWVPQPSWRLWVYRWSACCVSDCETNKTYPKVNFEWAS